MDSEGNTGNYTSLELREGRYPHISYFGDGDLRYAYKDGVGWHVGTIDSLGNVGKYGSLAMDGQGNPHISYYDDSNTDLKYAYLPGLPSMVLQGDIAGEAMVLNWSSVSDASEYWVYGAADMPFFEPGLAPGYENRVTIVFPPTMTWSSSAGVGNPDSNWTYLILAVDEVEQELVQSNRVGEFDFQADIP